MKVASLMKKHNGQDVELAALYDTKQTEIEINDGDTSISLPIKGHICVPAGNSQTLYAPLVKETIYTPSDTTKILMHFDDPDNPLKDECGVYPMYKVAGTASLTETNAKFGTALNFDGSTYFRTNGKVTFGGQDFTIDCWARLRVGGYNGAAPIWQLANSASQRIQFATDKSGDRASLYGLWGSTYNTELIVITGLNGTLHHFAFCYVHSTGTWYLFVDGILKGTSTWQISRRSTYLFLGYNNQGSIKLVGQLCEFRFIDGVALWTEDFTPPDKPYALYNGNFPPCIEVRRKGEICCTVR